VSWDGFLGNAVLGTIILGMGGVPFECIFLGKNFKDFLFLCPAALHTVANISMRNFPISLIFLVSGILFF
jgi:hypothetical protein